MSRFNMDRINDDAYKVVDWLQPVIGPMEWNFPEFKEDLPKIPAASDIVDTTGPVQWHTIQWGLFYDQAED